MHGMFLKIWVLFTILCICTSLYDRFVKWHWGTHYNLQETATPTQKNQGHLTYNSYAIIILTYLAEFSKDVLKSIFFFLGNKYFLCNTWWHFKSYAGHLLSMYDSGRTNDVFLCNIFCMFCIIEIDIDVYKKKYCQQMCIFWFVLNVCCMAYL